MKKHRDCPDEGAWVRFKNDIPELGFSPYGRITYVDWRNYNYRIFTVMDLDGETRYWSEENVMFLSEDEARTLEVLDS